MECSDLPLSPSLIESFLMSSPPLPQLTEWTRYENKLFENALAEFDLDTPDRFEKIASRVPGKTIDQIVKHYESLVEDIEFIDSGHYPIPDYVTIDELQQEPDHQASKQSGFAKGSTSGRNCDRRRGVPWTEEEHQLFLLGLRKYGKGDWRSISRNYVLTRTPTQVASHAQKFFIRLNSKGTKGRHRLSIHDIRSVNSASKPLMSGNTNFKPIAPAPAPAPSPSIHTPPMNFFPAAMRSNFPISNISNPPTASERRVLDSVPAPFGQPAFYNYNGEGSPALNNYSGADMNYLSNEFNAGLPSNTPMNKATFDHSYPPDSHHYVMHSR
ncbi:hypothetical protein HHK36_028559 [Tetracentron sinense]|uniref:Uncharacterized protein n=1 Tax=Tetracentron sinense TaxID=13715 RepID=A0A834YF88_TETSI|nr:hypothetical protein HHK36_028559 [Tetracentron sinense]